MDQNAQNQGASAAPNPLQDGKNIATDALKGLQAVCDKALGQVAAEEVKLSGEALDVANNFIASKAPGPVAGILTGVLQAAEGTAKPAIDAKAAAWIAIFRTDVDSAFGHLESALNK